MDGPTPLQLPDVLAFGGFRADGFARALVHESEGLIPLTPKQFDTLWLLLRHPGEVMDKDRILADVWAGSVVEENNLSQAISALRKALGDNGESHRYILTVPRKGYRFVAEVKPVAAEIAAPVLTKPPVGSDTALIQRTAPGTPKAPEGHSSAPKTSRKAVRWVWLAACVAVVSVAAWTWQHPAKVAATADRSVAVLPFTNLSADPKDAFFGAGITEDMLTQLAQISDLKVVSHQFAGAVPAVADRTLGQKLGAAHFLQGTVRRAEDRLRISAQLIDAETGRHLWAKSYDRPLADVLKVQSEVATEIATALAMVLPSAERAALGAYAEGNAELHLQYREGMYLISRNKQLTRDDRRRGVEIFKGLVDRYPKSPMGHLGLAAYHLRAPNFREAGIDESFREAERHIDAALKIDARSAEAYAMKAELEARARQNWRAAAEAAARAVTLNPSLPEAWTRYAHYGLQPLGRQNEAEQALRRALTLEPLNVETMHSVTYQLMHLDRCDEALAMARKGMEIQPSFNLLIFPMIRCHEIRGEFGEAVRLTRSVSPAWLPHPALDELQAATASDGGTGYWRTLLKWQRKFDARDPFGSYFLAAYLAQNGELDEAFVHLNRAIDKREPYLVGLRSDPLLKPLRSDPRWPLAIARVNF